MQQFVWMMAVCTVTMSAIAALYLLISPYLEKRYSARSLYIAWLVVLIGFLVPIRPQPIAPAITVRVPQAAMTRAMQRPVQAVPPVADVNTIQPAMEADAQLPDEPATIAPQPTSVQAKAPGFSMAPMQVVFIIWCAGALLVLFTRVIQHARFMRTVRRFRKPAEDEAMLAVMAAARDSMRVKRPVALYTCACIDSPMVVGLFRPVILLPDVPMTLSALSMVLRHELSHIRRGDLYGKALVLVCSAMHWFNPLMPFVSRAISYQCEAACDAEVTQDADMDTRAHYSETILSMIRMRQGMTTALSTRYVGGKKTLRKRLVSIMDMGRKRFSTQLIIISAVLVLVGGMAFALAAESSIEVPMEITYTAESPTQLGEDTETYARKGEVLAMFAKLIDTYRDELSDVEDLDRYTIGNMLTFVGYWMKDENALHAQMLACESADDVRALLQSDDISKLGEYAQTLEANVDTILEQAGFSNLPYRAYIPHIANSMRAGFDPEVTQTFTVYATGEPDPQTGERMTLHLYMVGMDRVSVMEGISYGYTGDLADITEEQREFARDRAKAFAKDHMYLRNKDMETTMVSDYVYTGSIQEPYTLVWIYSETAGLEGHTTQRDLVNFDYNDGVLMPIGLETGTVYGIHTDITEASFAIRAQAGKDWTANTGLAYPYMSPNMLPLIVSPIVSHEIFERLQQYEAGITQQDRHMAEALMELFYFQDPQQSQWQELMYAVLQSDTLSSFREALYGDYMGITQMEEPEKSREVMLGYADTALAAIGCADMDNRALVYTDTDQRPEVMARNDIRGREAWLWEQRVMLNFNGTLYAAYTSLPSTESVTESGGRRDATAEEIETIRARAEALVRDVCGLTLHEKSDTVVASTVVDMYNTDVTVARVFVPVEEKHDAYDENGLPTDVIWGRLIELDLNSDRVFNVYWSGEEDSVSFMVDTSGAV